jgi:predicted Zn-dependent protease with MMP-like domain
MRLNTIIIYLFVGVFLMSCSSDSDNDNGNVDPNNPKAGNQLPLGSSANDLLSDQNFSNLAIEIAVDDNVSVSNSALIDLEEFLEARTFKTNITITQRNNRTLYNTEDTIAVFILYLSGQSENDEGNSVTLGTAYRNTSLVLYKETIDNAGQPLNTPSVSEIESATLQHEFAHLFGLVDIGTEAQTPHVDPDSQGHCNVEDCLMIASIEFASGMIGMNSVPSLDPQCINDLQANGGR